jgi:putative tryptophan/tyrosine transport system substrate-binding protein
MFNQKNSQKLWTMLIWVVVVAMLLSGCGSSQPPKVYKVGILSVLQAFAPAAEGFKSKMAELGYVEGKNITYDLQQVDQVDISVFQKVTKKFIDDKVDLIFVFSTEASMEAKAAAEGSGIPVVFGLAFTDVAGVDLIDSVQKPGGNITGVRWPSVDIANKRLQILHEMAPDAKRIFVPYLEGYPNVPGQLEAIRQMADSLGLTLIEHGTTSPDDLQSALNGLATADDLGVDAIMTLSEPVSLTPPFYDVFSKFAYEHKIPIGGALMNPGGDGDLIFGLTPDPKTAGEAAALLADKIFRGTPAGTIPVVTSESVFKIDIKAAQALGVTVPDGLLKQADEIIK